MERVGGFAPPLKPWKGFVLLLHHTRIAFVGELGFEPRLNPPKGLVLPLHYSPICHKLYPKNFGLSKPFFYDNILIKLPS